MSITTATSMRRRRHEQVDNTADAEVFNAEGVAPAAAGADLTIDHTQSETLSPKNDTTNMTVASTSELPADVDGDRPPLTGRGSGIEAWRAYAIAQGHEAEIVDFTKKEQIIDLYAAKDAAAAAERAAAEQAALEEQSTDTPEDREDSRGDDSTSFGNDN